MLFDVDEIIGEIDDAIADIIREDARGIARTVILATPVGNPELWKQPPPTNYRPGTARGNWRVSIGGPDGQISFLLDPVGGTTIAAAEAEIARYTLPTQSLYIQNNVPYIVPLNDGSSTQAPAGFVQAAIAGVIMGDQGTEVI